MLRDTVQKFCAQEIAPHAQDIDAQNIFPHALWAKLGLLGVLGITVDAAYGGAGLGYLHQTIAMEVISCASASVGLSYAAHAHLCMDRIHSCGTEQQKKQYLPALVRGEKVGALAMSETGAGSDVMNMTLSAKKVGDYYQLNGHKMWITNGPEADVIVVYAKTKPKAGKKGITAFIVEKDFPGFSTAQKLDKLGMRGSNTCELVFDNCQVPCANVLGGEHQGYEILMNGLNHERIILAAGPVGIMQACLDIAIPYTQQRKQFGKPIGTFALIQAKLADIYSDLNASRAYLYATAQACDRQGVAQHDSASVLLFTAERATRAALETLQCFGGNGYTNEYPCGRLLRDAKLYEIGGGTLEIRRTLIGRALGRIDT